LAPLRLRSGFSRSASAYYCRFYLANGTHRVTKPLPTIYLSKSTYRFSYHFMPCTFVIIRGLDCLRPMAASELTSSRRRSGEWVASKVVRRGPAAILPSISEEGVVTSS
jgi:hypothetical protein